VNLDLLGACDGAREVPGTRAGPAGVDTGSSLGGDGDSAAGRPVRSRVGGRTWVLVAVVTLSLLGQGERCRVDPRFASPGATLATFWAALRADQAENAWECMVEGRHDLPLPGMLWFLPPTQGLWLDDFRSLPVTSGRVLVSYDVHYRPLGMTTEHSFRTGSELVRIRGAWRILRPIGEASMPEWWRPVPRSFDI
jgi:hypothetical protein